MSVKVKAIKFKEPETRFEKFLEKHHNKLPIALTVVSIPADNNDLTNIPARLSSSDISAVFLYISFARPLASIFSSRHCLLIFSSTDTIVYDFYVNPQGNHFWWCQFHHLLYMRFLYQFDKVRNFERLLVFYRNHFQLPLTDF